MILTSIRTVDVQKYVAGRLASGVSPSTAHKDLVVLKGMLKCAVEWDYLLVNPASPVKAPKRPHIEKDALTPDEVNIFLSSLDSKWHPVFLTLLLTGMRLGELRALMWSDIDWHSSTIRIRRSVWRNTFQEPKSKNSIRTIVMSPKLASVLRDYKNWAPKSPMGLVFCNEGGGILDDANLRHRVFEKTLSRAGLRKIRIHDLRHTYASLLINQGENLKYVQKQLGHASITTTVDCYGHLMPDMNKDAGARLDETLFGQNVN